MLIGAQTDIYAQYRNNDQPSLPLMTVCSVLGDVCKLRNKVAHGNALPSEWLARNRRLSTDLGRQLTYAEELLEAATGMLKLVWETIIANGLQASFADKGSMEAYFSPPGEAASSEAE